MTNIKGQPANRGKMISMSEFSAMWADPSLTLEQIGARLGITAQGVYMRAKARGLPLRGKLVRRKVRASDAQIFSAMWSANVGLKDLQRHFGCSHTVIAKSAQKLGLPKRKVTRWSTITVTDFFDRQTSTRMADVARAEQSMLAHVEMVDGHRRAA